MAGMILRSLKMHSFLLIYVYGEGFLLKKYLDFDQLKNIEFYELKETKRVNLLISVQYRHEYVAPKIIRNKFQKLF